MKSVALAIILAFFFQACKFSNTSKYSLPKFSVQLLDSSSVLESKDLKPKGKLLIMFFSPECPFCEKETEEFIANIEKLKDVTILMVSNQQIDRLKSYRKNYGLQDYNNIILAKDNKNYFSTHLNTTNYPTLMFYDNSRVLRGVSRGYMPVSEILSLLNSIG